MLPIAEDAKRRCIGVVELTRAHGPDETGEEAARQQKSDGQQKHDDAHTAPRVRRASKRVAPTAKATTLTELVGMRMAERSGDSLPLAANETPTTL